MLPALPSAIPLQHGSLLAGFPAPGARGLVGWCCLHPRGRKGPGQRLWHSGNCQHVSWPNVRPCWEYRQNHAEPGLGEWDVREGKKGGWSIVGKEPSLFARKEDKSHEPQQTGPPPSNQRTKTRNENPHTASTCASVNSSASTSPSTSTSSWSSLSSSSPPSLTPSKPAANSPSISHIPARWPVPSPLHPSSDKSAI